MGAVEETSLSEVRRIFEINFIGSQQVTQAVLPFMRAQKSGRIAFVSAIGGFTGYPGLGIYGAAKGALDIMAEALRGEVAEFGIQVSVVTLGVFRTDFVGRSLQYTDTKTEAYQETAAGKFRGFIGTIDGKQPGDPKRAAALFQELLETEAPPIHLPVGSDALEVMEAKIARLQQEIAQWRERAAETGFNSDA